MLTKRINQSITNGLHAWMVVCLVLGSLLAALTSSALLAQSAEAGFNPRVNDSDKVLAAQADGVTLVEGGFTIPDNSAFTDGSAGNQGQLYLGNPPLIAAADNVIYLPLVLKNFPLIPAAPVLNAISNTDGDGNYTVAWSSSEGADTYTLQEDDNAGFSNPATVYSGSSTLKAISGRDMGTYYYRVKASNAYASSEWSNVASVDVTVPLPDCPQAGLWHGDTSQGGGRNIDFVIENSPACQIAAASLRIEFRDGCGTNKTTVFNDSVPITNKHFEIEGASTQVTGDFSSSSTASGTFSYSATGCTASGTWTAALNLGANGDVRTLAMQADEKIVVGGHFSWLGGQPRVYIGRLNPDGSLDMEFNPGANGWVNALAVQEDGKILVGGIFTRLGGQTRNNIGRLNSDGTLDTTFNPGAEGGSPTVETCCVRSLAVQTDGKILVGGGFASLGGVTRSSIGRLNDDGTLDTTFNPDASSDWRPHVDALAVQADGKIVVGGVFTRVGGLTRNYIARLNPDGTLDTTFNPGANGSVDTLAVQADGKILVGGSFTTLGKGARNYIGRLNPDGTLDADFNPGAGSYLFALAVQADGKILVGGSFTTLGGETRNRIARLNSDGTLDADFNPGAGSAVYSLVVQPDGRIVVGGRFTTMGGEAHYYIARLNPDGTLDASFP
jgi:uncharacterized delta-60 repeat protein